MKADKFTGDSTERLEDTAAAWVFRIAAGLAPEEQAEFERWQAADPRNREALARHERAWSTLDRPRQAGQADVLLEKLAQRASLRRHRRAVGIGAAVALLIIGTTFWSARSPTATLAEARASIVRPETRTLADGSVVELKSGAEIAVDFSGVMRRVALRRGEAHFQVAHQERPFVVAAGDVEFRAVGTAFNVQLASGRVELLVTEGRVAVGAETRRRGDGETGRQGDGETRRQGTEDGGQTSVLRPLASDLRSPSSEWVVPAGNRVVVELARETGAAIVIRAEVPLEEMAERLAWRAPKLEFTDTPLAEAAALMNRHNTVRLVIEDATLGRLPVSGLFRADRAEAFVRLLEANFDVRAERSGGTIHLHRKH